MFYNLIIYLTVKDSKLLFISRFTFLRCSLN